MFLEINSLRFNLKEKCNSMTTESTKLSKMKETTEKEKKYTVAKNVTHISAWKKDSFFSSNVVEPSKR